MDGSLSYDLLSYNFTSVPALRCHRHWCGRLNAAKKALRQALVDVLRCGGTDKESNRSSKIHNSEGFNKTDSSSGTHRLDDLKLEIDGRSPD